METQKRKLNKSKTILICPLDWGLGHASRCVPLIYQFLNAGHHVIIGADKNPLVFLQQEFPDLKTVVIPGYEVEYSEKGSALKLFYESVKFYNFIKKEKQFLDAFLLENEIDMIVSDNRYGLYSDNIESIIITHQLYPKAPIGEKILHQKIEQLLSNFKEVWIPDYEGANNLSGELSHLKPFNQIHQFIGPLSRFEKPKEELEIEFDICAIISGPEPQRSIFEGVIMEQVKENKLKAVVVRGVPKAAVIASCHPDSDSYRNVEGETKQSTNIDKIPVQARNNDKIKIFNHLPTEQLQEYILKSKYVVCRSGYSSIMDLVVLCKKALLVPTPGQTEQEYLAEHHSNNQFVVQQQKDLDLRNLFYLF